MLRFGSSKRILLAREHRDTGRRRIQRIADRCRRRAEPPRHRAATFRSGSEVTRSSGRSEYPSRLPASSSRTHALRPNRLSGNLPRLRDLNAEIIHPKGLVGTCVVPLSVLVIKALCKDSSGRAPAKASPHPSHCPFDQSHRPWTNDVPSSRAGSYCT